MFEWLSTKFVKSIIGALSGPLLEGYKTHVAAMNSQDKEVAKLIISSIEAERDRRQAQKEMGILAMTHPLWWVAWGLFVIPVGLHHAAVYLLSTFGIGPETFAVLAVPASIRANGDAVVQFIFLSQSGAGVAGALMQRFMKR